MTQRAWRWVATTWGAPERWKFEEYELPAPEAGELTIRVTAAGVNPADAKHVAAERPGGVLPAPIGYEVAGIVTVLGDGSGPVRVGDEVLAFRVSGGYATHLTIAADKAFLVPDALSSAQAANLLLAGTTAAEMVAVVGANTGETILVHGASGAVGVSILQQAALRGIRVIGTASPARFDEVRRFGGIPVAHGAGLEERVRELGSEPIAAALDAVGTDEAVDVSLALVSDRTRIVTIAAAGRAQEDGFRWIAGALPDSARFRDRVRAELVDLAARGLLEVPIARTYPLAEAPQALAFLAEGHPGGKIALIP